MTTSDSLASAVLSASRRLVAATETVKTAEYALSLLGFTSSDSARRRVPNFSTGEVRRFAPEVEAAMDVYDAAEKEALAARAAYIAADNAHFDALPASIKDDMDNG